MNSYPPGTPPGHATTHSWHGALHNASATIVFLSLSAACVVVAIRFAAIPGQRRWAVYSAATAITVLILIQGLTTEGLGGLLQRITIAVGWGWITLVALRLRSQTPE
jgi:hypothetical membrane protein